MGHNTIEQLSTSAREQSLLRSLAVIHRSPKYRHSSDSDGSGNRIDRSAYQYSLLKRGRCGKVAPSESTPKCKRRLSLTSEVPPPTNIATTPAISRDGNLLTLLCPASSVDKTQLVVEHHYRRYRKDYALGETVRSPSHMNIEPTSAQAIRAASSLKSNDFAFVKRSDGSFSYAILAYRCMKRFRNSAKNKIIMEECMVFIVSSTGSTKMVRKRQSESVRLVRLLCNSPAGKECNHHL